MIEERKLRMLRICAALLILAATALLMLLPGRQKKAPDTRSFGRGNALMAMDDLSYYFFIRHEPATLWLYCRNLKDPRMRQKYESLLKQPVPKP